GQDDWKARNQLRLIDSDHHVASPDTIICADPEPRRRACIVALLPLQSRSPRESSVHGERLFVIGPASLLQRPMQFPRSHRLTCMSSYRVWMHSDRERKDAARAAAEQTSTFNPAERDIVIAGLERTTWLPLRV